MARYHSTRRGREFEGQHMPSCTHVRAHCPCSHGEQILVLSFHLVPSSGKEAWLVSVCIKNMVLSTRSADHLEPLADIVPVFPRANLLLGDEWFLYQSPNVLKEFLPMSALFPAPPFSSHFLCARGSQQPFLLGNRACGSHAREDNNAESSSFFLGNHARGSHACEDNDAESSSFLLGKCARGSHAHEDNDAESSSEQRITHSGRASQVDILIPGVSVDLPCLPFPSHWPPASTLQTSNSSRVISGVSLPAHRPWVLTFQYSHHFYSKCRTYTVLSIL